jgi:hypothetical protein
MNDLNDLQLPDWAYDLLLAIAIKKMRFKQDTEAEHILNFLSQSKDTPLVRRLRVLILQLQGKSLSLAEITQLPEDFSAAECKQIEARFVSLSAKPL